MTPATLAETILRDVKRYSLNMLAIEMYETPHGGWVKLPAVEAALTAALDPAIEERAGEVLRGVTPGPWTLCHLADQTPYSIQASYGCVNGLSALFTLAHINVPDEAEVGMTDGAFDRETADANARFIAWCREGVPALLAQIAALRAEVRKSAMDAVSAGCQAQEAWEAQKAAEAEVEKLRGALREIAERPSKMTWGEEYEVRAAMHDMGEFARAALAPTDAAQEPFRIEDMTLADLMRDPLYEAATTPIPTPTTAQAREAAFLGVCECGMTGPCMWDQCQHPITREART